MVLASLPNRRRKSSDSLKQWRKLCRGFRLVSIAHQIETMPLPQLLNVVVDPKILSVLEGKRVPVAEQQNSHLAQISTKRMFLVTTWISIVQQIKDE
jgi:hypothetical protein